MLPTRPWALVCPGSGGIGLALTQHLLNTTNVPVVATFRQDIEKARRTILGPLRNKGRRLKLLEVDVTDEDTIREAAIEAQNLFPLETHHLHLAFAIPGILHPEKSPRQIDAEMALQTFKVNVISNMLLIKHFTQFLPLKRSSFDEDDLKGLPKAHAIFALMSARVGSIGDNLSGGWYSYRSSKAAVTQLARTLDVHLRYTAADKAIAVALHPGTVRTGFTKGIRDSYERAGKVIAPEVCAEALLHVLEDMQPSARGRFWDWKGQSIPF